MEKVLRVLMLSWEYPPRIVGGIARHVEELSWALARSGVDVHIVTCAFPGAAAEETYNGVHIRRVEPYQPTNDFVHWVQQLNAAMYDSAADLVGSWLRSHGDGKRDGESPAILLHAHDWVAHYSAARLKHEVKLPLVATIHATEHGRNQGIHTPQQRYIASVETELVAESWRTIVCSDFMRDEVRHVLAARDDALDVIPNAIAAEKFAFDFPAEEALAFRAQYAAQEERLIVFSGRMVREKGCHILIEAVAALRHAGTQVKLVVVGGGDRGALVSRASDLGIAPHVYFTGFVPDDVLLRLYRVADAAVFPSLYEPFGIVALEAMAAGTPVVVSDAGGLKEIVAHDSTGTVVWSGSVDSLVWGLRRVFDDPSRARALAVRAQSVVQDRYNWDLVAFQTRGIYDRVWSEYLASGW